MVPADSDRISRVPPYSGYCYFNQYLCVLDFHHLRYTFPGSFHFTLISDIAVLQPLYCLDNTGLGYSPFDRHYWGNHFCFLFLRVLRCFSSPGLPSDCSEYYAFSIVGCPIRKSTDISDICSSPLLIAACHVLLRLWEPRHSPCALIYFLEVILLTFILPICQRTLSSFRFLVSGSRR
jgi:hypothetical protein